MTFFAAGVIICGVLRGGIGLVVFGGVVAPLLWLFSGMRAELGRILNFGLLIGRVP